jgi:hypothetical protein
LNDRPIASVRLSGERWVAFEHAPTGAKILGWFNVQADAAEAAERVARARLPLEVVA